MLSIIPGLKSCLGLSTAQPCSMEQGTARLQLLFWRSEPACVFLLQDRGKPLLPPHSSLHLLQGASFSPSLMSGEAPTQFCSAALVQSFLPASCPAQARDKRGSLSTSISPWTQTGLSWLP